MRCGRSASRTSTCRCPPSGCGPRSIHLAADRLRLHSPPRPLLSKSPVRKDPGLRRTTGALFLWFLFRHPLGIPALGLGLRILRALLRLVAAFLHVGLRVVDHSRFVSASTLIRLELDYHSSSLLFYGTLFLEIH